MLKTTATNLPRLMFCNGSYHMSDPEHKSIEDTTVRDEGIAAHWLIEQVHGGGFVVEELIDRKAPNGVYITVEMVEHLEEYIKDVKNAQIEIDTSTSGTNWYVGGRADAIRWDESIDTLIVSDLKYGWRIVEPKENWTLLFHAMSYLSVHKLPAKRIILAIYQPRVPHSEGRMRTWSISMDELKEYSARMLTVLNDPSNILNTNPYCHNCPKLAFCPAVHKAQYNAIDESEKAYNDEIDNETLSFELDQIDRALEILKERKKAYNDLGIHRARKGQIIQNYGIEKSLTNRMWKKGVTPSFVKTLSGGDYTKEQLLTPAQAEKKGLPKEVTAALTERREKGMKLVRRDINIKAKKIFNN